MAGLTQSITAFVRLSRRERVQFGLSALGALAVLGLSAILTPDPRGVGTHEQLGLPPCMTQWIVGIPCPFCGMTTAFTLMAHGQPFRAFQVQPAGALAFFAAWAYLGGCLLIAMSGRLPAPFRDRTLVRMGWGMACAVVALGWVYKLYTHFYGQ